jgi:hypothetical protein
LTADAGTVEVFPETTLRLVRSDPKGYRFRMERGRVETHLVTPARRFIIETPAGDVVDLGCSFTLKVEPKGMAQIHVASGRVSIEFKKRSVYVPAGANCSSSPEVGPGLPYFEDASKAFRSSTALLSSLLEASALDAEYLIRKSSTESRVQRQAALQTVLRTARLQDTLTLWHLASRVAEAERARIYDRLIQLAPPPEGVTREDVIHWNERRLSAWREQLEGDWQP